MAFNTFGRSTKTIGGDSIPVWFRVDSVLPSGVLIDISGKSAGDIIPAGSMVAYDHVGGSASIIAATAESTDLATVNGLLKNDIFVDEGATKASGTVVIEGIIYSDRVNVPAGARAGIPRITFINDEAPAAQESESEPEQQGGGGE